MPRMKDSGYSGGILYAIRREKDGLIKLGFTTNMKQRMSGYRSTYKCAFTALGFLPGHMGQEHVLLDCFRQFAVNLPKGGHTPEWFAPAPELMRFIERKMFRAVGDLPVGWQYRTWLIEMIPDYPTAATFPTIDGVFSSKPIRVLRYTRHIIENYTANAATAGAANTEAA